MIHIDIYTHSKKRIEPIYCTFLIIPMFHIIIEI